MAVGRLSTSKLYVIQSCGERYHRQQEERRPGSAASVRGRAVHEVARKAHRAQMDAKESGGLTRAPLEVLPSFDEARELAATAFEQAILSDGVEVPKEEAEEAGGRDAAIGKAKDAAVLLGGSYVRKVAPGVNPLAVERKVVVQPKGLGFEISGVMDLVESDGADGEMIPDLKTTSKSPNKDAAERSQQLRIYALLRAADVGKIPTKGMLRHLVAGAKGVSVVTQETEIRREDLRAVLSRVEQAARAVEAGIFLPADPSWWGCAPKWCPYWSDCKYVIGRR